MKINTPTTIFPFDSGENGRTVYGRTGRTTKNGRTDGES
jgi:hypothetical protein